MHLTDFDELGTKKCKWEFMWQFMVPFILFTLNRNNSVNDMMRFSIRSMFFPELAYCSCSRLRILIHFTTYGWTICSIFVDTLWIWRVNKTKSVLTFGDQRRKFVNKYESNNWYSADTEKVIIFCLGSKLRKFPYCYQSPIQILSLTLTTISDTRETCQIHASNLQLMSYLI